MPGKSAERTPAEQATRRRRAVVTGAAVTVLLLLAFCRGGGDADGNRIASSDARAGTSAGTSAGTTAEGAAAGTRTTPIGGSVPDSLAPVAGGSANDSLRTLPGAAAIPGASTPLGAGDRGTSGRNPLDVNDTRDLGPNVSNDVRIALEVVSHNLVDSSAAEMAVTGARRPDVRAFAALVVREHGEINRRALAISRRLDDTPLTPRANRAIRSAGAADLVLLRAAADSAYDAAYLATEIAAHQRALGRLDRDLIHAAQDPELKRLLAEMRPAVIAHLARARDLAARN